MNRASRFATLLCLTVAMAGEVSAHEIGTTQVHALFRTDSTYQIDVTTAPQPLLNKLEARAGHPRSSGLGPDQLRRKLENLSAEIPTKVEIRFGDRQVRPQVHILLDSPADPDSPISVVVRLTGDIPHDAGPFTWKYGWSFTSYALSLENERHGQPVREWLEGEQQSAPFPIARNTVSPSRTKIILQYLALGFTHIVPHGLDHILFVLGIFLLTTKLKPILMQVTAFTVAHSITLALTIYGLVSISPRIVEPLIALSIAYVAIENLITSELKPWRIPIVFAFGLLHGMGFAGVLRQVGLPKSEIIPALVAFNAGVEGGQLTVIAVALLVVGAWSGQKSWYRSRVVVPASLVIGATGFFWTVQRLMG